MLGLHLGGGERLNGGFTVADSKGRIYFHHVEITERVEENEEADDTLRGGE